VTIMLDCGRENAAVFVAGFDEGTSIAETEDAVSFRRKMQGISRVEGPLRGRFLPDPAVIRLRGSQLSRAMPGG